MKISVITPSVRPDGLSIIAKALRQQEFTDYEWLVGSVFEPNEKEARWIKDEFKGGFWTLNRIYNKLFAEAKGELIVSWQDYISANPDGLQKFWDNYKKTNALISGVGDQYQELNKYGKPTIKIWSDPRRTTVYGSFYESLWNDCEWNYAAIPRKLFWDVGGMDEALDFKGYGGDQLQTCERLNDFGAHFFLDQTNESFTLRHNRDAHGGQENWDGNHVLFNGEYQKRKETLKEAGQWPVLINETKPVI